MTTAAMPATADKILTTVLIVPWTEPVEAPGLHTTFPLESTVPAALQAPHSICCLAVRLEVSAQEIPAADAKLMTRPMTAPVRRVRALPTASELPADVIIVMPLTMMIITAAMPASSAIIEAA